MSLTEEMLSQEPDGSLYHYTSIQGILGILRSGVIWASHIAYLNDHSEFNHAIEIARDFLGKNMKTSSGELSIFYEFLHHMLPPKVLRLPSSLYVASFSSIRDSLPLWRGYCSDNAGYSFGFDWNRHIPNNAILAPCIYDNDKKRAVVGEILEEAWDSDPEEIRRREYRDGTTENPGILTLRALQFLRLFYSPAAFFKDSAFRDEKEWRVVIPQTADFAPKEKYRPGRTLVVPYTELSLVQDNILHIDEIVVGPTVFMDAARQAIERLIKSLNDNPEVSMKIEYSKVSLSSVPYRIL